MRTSTITIMTIVDLVVVKNKTRIRIKIEGTV